MPEIVDADGGLVADDLLLHDLADGAVVAQAAVAPLRVVGPEGHDEPGGALAIPGVQIFVNVQVHDLIAVGNHERGGGVNELPGEKDRAGGAFGDGIDGDDVASGTEQAQFGRDLGILFEMLGKADEGERVGAGRRDVLDNPRNHRAAADRDEWLRRGVAGVREARAAASHGDDNLQGFHAKVCQAPSAAIERRVVFQERLDVLRSAHAVHHTIGQLARGDGLPVQNQLVVNRCDEELPSRGEALHDHPLGCLHEVASRPEIIQAGGGLLADGALLGNRYDMAEAIALHE